MYEESNMEYLISLIDRDTSGRFVGAIGINRCTLSRWRRHLNTPSRYFVRKTCRFFGVEEDVLKNTDLKAHPEHISRFSVRRTNSSLPKQP